MKTTKQDFLVFQEECGYWIEYFGIKSEDILYLHRKTNDSKAEYIGDYSARNLTITLATNWETEPSDFRIRQSAFHEITEQLFDDLRRMVRYCFNMEETDRHTHSVVRILENTIFKEHYERRFGTKDKQNVKKSERKR